LDSVGKLSLPLAMLHLYSAGACCLLGGLAEQELMLYLIRHSASSNQTFSIYQGQQDVPSLMLQQLLRASVS
jgi:hypothetical protein